MQEFQISAWFMLYNMLCGRMLPNYGIVHLLLELFYFVSRENFPFYRVWVIMLAIGPEMTIQKIFSYFFYKTRGLKLSASEVWRNSAIKMSFGFWFQIWYMLNFINMYMDESYIKMHVIVRNLLAITSNFDLLLNW
jgi:hypothetical protein